jgi:predicted secreted protein
MALTQVDQGLLGTNAQYTGFKNRIINGAMVISQRGTSPTITGGGDYSLDRFGSYYSGNAFTSVQSTTAPAGFINSMLFTVTSTSASPTYSFFYQRIEGFNCADLGFGLSTASTITLSFWVRSSVTGIYSIALGNDGGNRSYAAQYTINSANTWEQKTITILGDTSGTWLTNNAVGIGVRWNMGTSSGSRLISAGSWQAANADGATGSTGANTWANTASATFYITGVQLEKGSTATSFDYRPYGTEFALCQRYYQSNRVVWSGYLSGSGQAMYAYSTFKVTMRASATGTITGEALASFSAGSLSNGATDSIRYDITSSASNSQGYAFATVNASAEL